MSDTSGVLRVCDEGIKLDNEAEAASDSQSPSVKLPTKETDARARFFAENGGALARAVKAVLELKSGQVVTEYDAGFADALLAIEAKIFRAFKGESEATKETT